MYKLMASVVILLGGMLCSGIVFAQTTVECVSHDYHYNECYAPLEEPQLIYQKSQSACIVNRTWGFNPKKHTIWVNNGCKGVFADPEGYYHGRNGGFDKGARHYGKHGHDKGAMVTGAVVGALIAGSIEEHEKHKHKHYTTSNGYYHRYDSNSGYTGCHGVGCKVDKPRRSGKIDKRPQFDKEGNPNFDTHGNYQGCHGVGCKVDNPDSGH